MSMMSVVKVKVIYDYYATKRVTLIFMMEEDLMNLSYDEFKTRLEDEFIFETGNFGGWCGS